MYTQVAALFWRSLDLFSRRGHHRSSTSVFFASLVIWWLEAAQHESKTRREAPKGRGGRGSVAGFFCVSV